MKLSFLNRPWKDLVAAASFLGVSLLLVFAAVWAYHTFMTSPYVDPEKYPVRGIDVSAHNGVIDMQKVADSGVEFVFIKATEGVDFKDRNFRTNFDKARRAGCSRESIISSVSTAMVWSRP